MVNTPRASGTPKSTPCPKCNATLGSADYKLKCGKCSADYHHKCLQLTDSQYNAFIKFPAGLITFYCPTCKLAIETMEQRICALEQASATANVIAGPLVSDDAIAAIVTKVIEAVLPKVMDVCRGAAEEAVEMQSKKSSLVLIGLPEAIDLEKFATDSCNALKISRDGIVDIFRNGQTRAS